MNSSRSPQLRHHYGESVTILDDVGALSLLAKLCVAETVQPDFNRLIELLYTRLFWAAAESLPCVDGEIPTRMVEHNPEAILRHPVVQHAAPCVVVDIARAGILPSHVFFGLLNQLVAPANVRQDHLIMARTTDDAHRVTGSAILGGKVGGRVDNATLFIPDPMGATGASVSTVIEHYLANYGNPTQIVCVNLIVTPEYLKAISRFGSLVRVVALRVDRGMSQPSVLAAEPGARWSEESGLNEHSYIVPGGGGFGELMNNSWV